MCARFSQQCPVYTIGHTRSSSLQRNFVPQTTQTFKTPQLPHFNYPASPPALQYDPQFVLQMELTKTRKELEDNQQNLQDIITQLEDERAKSSSTAAEVASLQQQLTFEERQKQRVEQNLEEITSRLLLAGKRSRGRKLKKKR